MHLCFAFDDVDGGIEIIVQTVRKTLHIPCAACSFDAVEEIVEMEAKKVHQNDL